MTVARPRCTSGSCMEAAHKWTKSVKHVTRCQGCTTRCLSSVSTSLHSKLILQAGHARRDSMWPSKREDGCLCPNTLLCIGVSARRCGCIEGLAVFFFEPPPSPAPSPEVCGLVASAIAARGVINKLQPTAAAAPPTVTCRPPSPPPLFGSPVVLPSLAWPEMEASGVDEDGNVSIPRMRAHSVCLFGCKCHPALWQPGRLDTVIPDPLLRHLPAGVPHTG